MAGKQASPSATGAPGIPAITLNGIEVDFSPSDISFSVKDLETPSKPHEPTTVTTSPRVLREAPALDEEISTGNFSKDATGPGKSSAPCSPATSGVVSNSHPRGRQGQATQKNRQRRHSVHNVSRDPVASPSFGASKDAPSTLPQASPRASPQASAPKLPPVEIFDKSLEGGWRMKTRTLFSPRPVSRINVDIVLVYVYSTAMEQAHGHDADLALFTYEGGPEKTVSPLIPSIQRARTAQVPDTRRSKSSPFAPAYDTTKSTLLPTSTKDLPTRDGRLRKGSPERTQKRQSFQSGNRLNWLSSPDMLPKQFPRARVTTVGFDLGPASSAPLDFESASNQLLDYLEDIRKGKTQPPILLLGHSYGGIFIIQSLTKIAKQNSNAKSLLEKTAGVFLFSCTHLHSTRYNQLVANLVSEKPTAKAFASMAGGMPQLNKLAQTFKATIFQPGNNQRPRSPNQTDEFPEPESDEIRLAFPIVQFVTSAEKPDAQKPKEANTEFLKLPTRTITLEKDFANALVYSGPGDPDFLRIMLLMHSGLRAHQFLYTVANEGYREVQKMINDKYSVNIRDRWNQSALHVAVRRNDEAMVRLLLRAGEADPNVRDARLNTPLHYAVKNDNANIVGELLERGADINCENDRKQKPKDLVKKGTTRNRVSKMLKSQLIEGPDRADTNMRLGNNTLPSSPGGKLACKNYQITVTEMFESAGQDKHWTVCISVQELLYSSLPLEEILQSVRPNSVREKTPFCVWVHIPENNMIWVEDLFVKLRIHPAIWQGRRGVSGDSLRNRVITPHVIAGDISSVFVPYISYETNARQAKRCDFVQMVDKDHQQKVHNHQIIEQHIPQPSLYGGGLTSPHANDSHKQLLSVPDIVERDDGRGFIPLRDRMTTDSEVDLGGDTLNDHDLDEEEKGLIKEYLHDPAALHIRRTLDQYYYHMLSNTNQRDGDQVVSRWACNVKDEQVHNILMVDQLWLWMADRNVRYARGQSSDTEKLSKTCDYVISCFPGRTGAGESTQQRWVDDLRQAVLLPRNKQREPILQPRDLVSRILTTCFDGFDKLQSSESVRFFNIFEDTIGAIDNRETLLFQKFRSGSQQRHKLDRKYKHFDQKKQELLEQLLDIREETELLVEVKDIRDEINIILSVLRTQQSLAKQLRSNTHGPEALFPSSSVELLVEANICDFEKLNSQAKAAQDNLNTLMDLKQKAANAWEAREAREIALQAGKQGNTMLVFTVVTIIFLPLSFTSTFFAIGVSAFPKDTKTGQTNWPLGLIVAFIFGISLSFSIPLIVFAINMQKFTTIWRDIRHDHILRGALILLATLPQSPRIISWIQRIRQSRDSYLNEHMIGDSGGEHDPSVEDDDDSLTLVPTWRSSDSDGVAKPDDDRKFATLKRFRRKVGGGNHRTDVDEEASGETR